MNGSPVGKLAWADSRLLHVELADGRVISTPLAWYSELANATIKDLTNYRFICDGTGVEWPSLDYHLSIAGMLAARPMLKAA